jgi:VPDSG-CTERM motif
MLLRRLVIETLMKSLKYLLAIAALAGIAVTANAATITLSPFGDIPKNGTGIGGGNSNNADNNFFRLQNYLSDHPEFDVCTPISTGAVRVESNLDQPVDVTGFSYAVVHYGVGKGGTKGSGGGIAFFQISGSGSVTFPQSGSGPNGFGGISSLDLFKCEDHNVPDTGATAMLLGSALTGLGLARRYLKR